MNEISKFASVIYRSGQIYYDEKLIQYQIGCGQQFFLIKIHDQPGISQFALAELGFFDKGTTARAVKKLEELGYIERRMDEHDHRMTRLYLCEKGKPLIPIIKKMQLDWLDALTKGFSEEEKEQVASLMKRLSENARTEVGRR